MSNTIPTLKDIARRLNVSVSTVSRALHNHKSIGLGTTMQVHKLASDLNYEPNQNAILFKKKKTLMIGVILPSLSTEYFASIIKGIEDIAQINNYTVLFCQSRDDMERERTVIEALKNNRVDGILISIAKDTNDYSHLETLKKYNIPVVYLDRIPDLPDIHCISARLDSGMIEAVNFLYKNNHRKIAFINGPSGLRASQDRLSGYLTAHKKNRKKADPDCIVSTDLSNEGTIAAMDQLLDMKIRPSAIIVFNDYVAMDAISYARKRNIQVNKDLFFVSFANDPFCHYMDNGPIASVEQFPYEQGEKATELLLQLLNKAPNDPETFGSNIFIESKLVIHEPV